MGDEGHQEWRRPGVEWQCVGSWGGKMEKKKENEKIKIKMGVSVCGENKMEKMGG